MSVADVSIATSAGIANFYGSDTSLTWQLNSHLTTQISRLPTKFDANFVQFEAIFVIFDAILDFSWTGWAPSSEEFVMMLTVVLLSAAAPRT